MTHSGPVRVVAGLVGVVAIVVAVGVAGGPDAGAAKPRRCNGAARLCTRRLDQVAFPTTHNSNAAGRDGVRFPNQRFGMARQLRDGVRGFQIDAFLGTERRKLGRTVVFTDMSPRVRAKFAELAGPQATAAANQLRRRVGPPRADQPRDVYLCHNFCELGAVKMLSEARHFARFLRRHPNEVVIWVVQDELPAERLLPVLREAGLDRYLATVDPTRPLPTLDRLIESDHRLLVGLENGDLAPRLLNVFESGLVQEVPYRFERVADLRAAASCRPLRGSPDAPLFQFNHWITPASRRASREVNQYDFLADRALMCQEARGLLPNLVAVDFYDSGGLFRVSRMLNDRERVVVAAG